MIKLAIILSFLIPPNSKNILSWDMFKGPIDSAEVAKGAAANVNTHWRLSDISDGEKHVFVVEYDIDENKSWALPEAKNDYCLAHEQTHAWISVIMARKCIKALEKYQGCSDKRAKQAWKLFDSWWKEMRALNALFDKETAHSLNTTMEKQWEEKIKNSLK